MKKIAILSFVVCSTSGFINASVCGQDLTKKGSHSSIEGLAATVEVHTKTLLSHGADLAKVGPAVEELGKKIDLLVTRFDGADLLNVKGSIGNVEKSLVVQNGRIDAVEEALRNNAETKLAGRLDGHDEALKAHSEELASMRQNLRRLYYGVSVALAGIVLLTCEEIREALPFFKR